MKKSISVLTLIDRYGITVASLSAMKVLERLANCLSQEALDGMIIVDYQNCREEGYTLKVDGFENTVTFSENRNSDHIVVYVNFFTKEGGMREESYKAAKYFEPTPQGFKDAVKFCLTTILNLN